MKNWDMPRCVDFWAVQGATREHTPRGSVTQEQRSTAQKAAQPSGRGHLGPSGGVARARPPSNPLYPEKLTFKQKSSEVAGVNR